MKLGSSRAMDTKRPRGLERSKPRHELQLPRRWQPPYPWPPEQAQPGVSKPYRTTPRAIIARTIYWIGHANDWVASRIISPARRENGARNRRRKRSRTRDRAPARGVGRGGRDC